MPRARTSRFPLTFIDSHFYAAISFKLRPANRFQPKGLVTDGSFPQCAQALWKSRACYVGTWCVSVKKRRHFAATNATHGHVDVR
jgi:hypothetical protein